MHGMASNCLSLWLGRATEWAKLNTRLHSGAAPLAAPRAVRCRVAWGCRVLWWRDLLLWKAYRGVNRISSIIDAAFGIYIYIWYGGTRIAHVSMS